MRPEWFAYDDIPFDEMWKDDEQWFPLLLKGQHFIGQYHFSEVNREYHDILNDFLLLLQQ
jgi:hypothetical protein